MQLFKKIGEGLLIASFSFLLFIVLFEDWLQLPSAVQVMGRMHPMFLHFPIVLLLIYFFTLWTPRKENESLVDGIRLLAALTAVITAVMGMLLSLEEEREGSTFFWHKWGGIFIAFLSFLLYYVHPFILTKKWIVRPFTLVISFIVLLTGHWGANLTHGENYLLQPLASNEEEKVPLDQALAFEHVVLPIFEKKCVSCHGASNTKGGLILEDSLRIVKGGKTGPLFLTADAENSLIVKRILLPLEDKKHMAPKSKPQLTKEEIVLLESWIKGGAPFNKKIIDLPAQDSFRLMASAYLSPSSIEGQIAYHFPPADDSKIKALNNNYRVVTPLGLGSPALSVQFYGKNGYSPKALEELQQVKEQIIELNLARLPVKDEDLKPVLSFQNLRKLNLNYTDITDKGLQQLTALKNLNELAISGTKVSASVLTQLARSPQLSALYVWNTGLDSSQISSLKQINKSLKIETGYKDDGQTILPLNPPIAKTSPGIYDSSTLIELKHPFRGVEIRYTLDESEPDSVNSQIYTKPLKLEKFTVVKAKAYKPGWYGSKPMKAVYFTKGLIPDSVAFAAKGQENRGKEKMLFDTEIGDLNLSSGNWLELKEPTTYQLFFNQPVAVHQLALNTFVRMEWDIFPASKIEVWGGSDKSKIKKIGTWQKAPPSKMEDPDLRQPIVHFDPALVRYMQVVIYPLSSLPSWRPNKGKPSRVFVSEVVLN